MTTGTRKTGYTFRRSSPVDGLQDWENVEAVDLLDVIVHKGNGLRSIQVNGESIICTVSERKMRDPKLPKLIASKPTIERRGLPLGENLNARVVGDGAEVGQASGGAEPAILFHDDRLMKVVLRSNVVFDELVGPRDGLAPRIGVKMESAVIDMGKSGKCVEVDTVRSIVRPVGAARVIEESFASDADQVVLVERLDVCRDLAGPIHESGSCAVGASREVSDGVTVTTRFVCKLPSEDGGGVDVASHNGLDIVLVCGNDLWVGVEVVVVFASKIDRVDIHPTIVSPVVGESHNKFDAFLFSKLDHLVETSEAIRTIIDGGLSIRP